MSYSLDRAAALGFDLVRLPAGPDVAEVVLHALGADGGALQELANQHPGLCRARCWDVVRARASGRPPLRVALQLAQPALTLATEGDGGRGQELLTRIVGSPLGDLAALDRFLRRDVLDWTWEVADDVELQRLRDRRAADVLVDGAAAAFCRDLVEEDLRRHLSDPYLIAVRHRRSADQVAGQGLNGLGALAPAVRVVLRQVAQWVDVDRQAWRRAVNSVQVGDGSWSAAMREAGAAGRVTGRTRAAAAAQLHAVRSFRSAGLTPTDAASGSWNALSGVVEALSVIDLLGEDETATLLHPWYLARGRQPGT